MRSELEQLEHIDQYLSGKLSADQAASFESEMAKDPALNSLVKEQELLIKTVNRKALMAEINAVAGMGAGATGATAWGITQWLITGAVVIGVGVASVLVFNAMNSDQEEQLPLVTEQTEELTEEDEVLSPKDTGDYFAFTLGESPIEEADFIDEQAAKEDANVTQTNQNPTLEKTDKKGLMVPLTDLNDIANKDKKESDTKLHQEKQQPVHNVDRNRRATFPGGLEMMKAFFQKELLYPRTPKDKGLSGTVRVKFLVTAEGEITELRSECFILKDIEGLRLSDWKFASNGKSRRIFEDRAERIFRISQPWTPATNSEGNPVLSEQIWYVNFDLNGESSIYQLEDDKKTSYNDQPMFIELK